LLLQLLSIHFCYAQPTKIRVWSHTEDKPGIIGRTMHRALQLTNQEFGSYTIIRSNEMGQDRALRALAHDQLDIAHFVATESREQQAIAVYTPIMQGLLGYRLCLIDAVNQEKFFKITNVEQWIEKELTIGQHHNWPDSAILKDNNLKIVTTYKSDLLFQQLAKNRFDCFARGLSEISDEQLKYQQHGIVIEKNIVIYYPLAQFFFVNPEKPILAKRLQKGLSLLQESGELNDLFDNYYREKINQLNLRSRVFIPLNNNTLSKKTIKALETPSTRFKKIYLSD